MSNYDENCIHRRARELYDEHIESVKYNAKCMREAADMGIMYAWTHPPCERDVIRFSRKYCDQCKRDNPGYKERNDYFLC